MYAKGVRIFKVNKCGNQNNVNRVLKVIKGKSKICLFL